MSDLWLDRSNIPTFADVHPDKTQALKPLEEAAEVYGAWQLWWMEPCEEHQQLVVNEVCDMFQAGANLLAAMGVESIESDMVRMRKRNEARGREYA